MIGWNVSELIAQKLKYEGGAMMSLFTGWQAMDIYLCGYKAGT